MKNCSAICILLSCFYTSIAYAQDSSKTYWSYYTGCWKTEDSTDGLLMTNADWTFQWIKPMGNTFDTAHGTWDRRTAFGIPFKATVIALEFSNGKRKKYEIDVTSAPAVIYLSKGHQFHKIRCE